MSVRVLLTGATGFVGSRVFPALVEAGFDVVCTSRDPARARTRNPNRTWVRLNVELPETLAPAMEGVDVVIYLVHSIGTAANYGQVERASASSVRDAAADTVQRCGGSGASRRRRLGHVIAAHTEFRRASRCGGTLRKRCTCSATEAGR